MMDYYITAGDVDIYLTRPDILPDNGMVLSDMCRIGEPFNYGDTVVVCDYDVVHAYRDNAHIFGCRLSSYLLRNDIDMVSEEFDVLGPNALFIPTEKGMQVTFDGDELHQCLPLAFFEWKQMQHVYSLIPHLIDGEYSNTTFVKFHSRPQQLPLDKFLVELTFNFIEITGSVDEINETLNALSVAYSDVGNINVTYCINNPYNSMLTITLEIPRDRNRIKMDIITTPAHVADRILQNLHVSKSVSSRCNIVI